MNDSRLNPAQRDLGTVGKIRMDADVLVGKPRIDGTRISVELILREMSAGMTVDDLLRAYPQLYREDIQAALGYALRSIQREEIRPLSEAAG